ncbi:MAG: type II secretion system minor pseudopilin GspJ [Gammaproteobacteria bacterium]
MNRNRQQRAFTLIELLVAMAIFSFLATAMFTGIRQIVLEREILVAQVESLIALQRTVRYLNNDFSQLHPRDVRDELGRDRIASLSSDPSQDFAVLLSRDGWRNPAEAPRGTLQRVQYRLEDETLIREYWSSMDNVLGVKPRSIELLEGIESLEIAYLTDELEWIPDWPPADFVNTPDPTTGEPPPGPGLPKAIRYRLTLQDFGEIERLVEVVQ